MKSPAFQFYPTDWIGSQRVQMLTLEEEGAYIRLVCSCWQHGSIPADPEQAARLIGKGASTTLATTVLKMFEPGESGRMIHDRLESERVKQAEWRAKSAAGGRKSAEIRKGGSGVVQPPYQPNGNTPSSSPSPSTIIPPVVPQVGREKKEWKPTPEQLRLGALFKRKPVTPFDEKELAAWKKISPIDPDDFAAVEKFYTAAHPPDADYRIRSLQTLLNGWNRAVDQARRHQPKREYNL